MIAGRVLQGVAGGVFPLAFGIVRDTFPRERVPAGLAMISAIFGIGGGIGLPLSGVVVDDLDLQLAVLDQPDLAARRVRRPPADPAVAAGRRTRGSTGPAPRSCPSRSRAILLGVSEADDVGLGLAANVARSPAGCCWSALFVVVEAPRRRSR